MHRRDSCSIALHLKSHSIPRSKFRKILVKSTTVIAFANEPGDWGSIPGRVIPKTQKMVLDTSLLNTQHHKVRFKGKVEQSREWCSALPYSSV